MYFMTNYEPTPTKLIFRKKYDPKAYSAEGGLIFDAAVQRYDLPLSFSRCNICTLQVARTSVHLRGSLQANFHQLHQVQPHRRHPRIPVLPVVLGATSQGLLSTEITWNLTPFLLLQEYSRAVRRGEVAYDADSRKMKYFN